MTHSNEPFALTPPEPDEIHHLGFPDDAEYYALDAKRRVIPATQEQFEAMPDEAKLVNETTVGEVTVVTEFLGYDNSDGEEAEPLVFQTFLRLPRGERQGGCFATWAEAAADHRRTVEHLRSTGTSETRH